MKKQTEDCLQQKIYITYHNKFCLLSNPIENRSLIFSIPNGSFRDIREAVKLKATGLLAGASDLIIIHAPHNNKLYFVELKTPEAYAKSNHGMSKEQLEFQSRVTALGYTYLLFHTLKDFCLFFGI